MNMSQTAAKQNPSKNGANQKQAPACSLKEFFGKRYVLHRSENYEEFLRELGVKKITRLKAMNSKPTITLSHIKGKYVLSTSYPEGRQITVQFKPGKEIHRRESLLNPTTSVFKIVDNKIIEEQTIGDVKVVTEREFKRKEVFVTMKVNAVKCSRWYTLVEDSRHSIKTETSRRSMLWKPTSKEKPMKVVDKPKTPSETEEEEEEEEEEDEVNVCY